MKIGPVAMLLAVLLDVGCADEECQLSGDATVFELNVNFGTGTSEETIQEVVECVEGRIVERFPPSLVTVEISGRDKVCDALDTLESEESVNNVVIK